MPGLPEIALLALAYLLGGLSPGYWLVRWRTGLDVRNTGSGGTGATNVGRVLGRGAYAVVLVTDLAKGGLVGFAGRYLMVGDAWAYGAAVAVVVGHVWPVWLGFRGGKGVGPFIGSWLVLAPLALIPSLLLGLLLVAWVRRVSIAGLFGLALLPAAAWWVTAAWPAVAAACCIISLLLWTHRHNLRKFVAERLHYAPAPASDAPTNSS